MSKLIQSIKNSKWEEVTSHLDYIDCTDRAGWTALHWACYMKTPFQIFATIFYQSPSAIKKVNKDGGTPLHFAVCNENMSEVYIDILIEYAPEIAFLRNDYRLSPLELALTHCHSLDIVKALYCSHKTSTAEKECQIERFFIAWYATVKKFVRNKPESMSRQEILKTKIESSQYGLFSKNELNMKYIYDICCLLLKGLATSDSYTENDDFEILPAAFQSSVVPWIFCELFICINPNDTQSMIPKEHKHRGNTIVNYFNASKKSSTYNKIFSCCECGSVCKTVFASGYLFCVSCTEDYYSSYALHRDDDLEQMLTIYLLIKECPYVMQFLYPLK